MERNKKIFYTSAITLAIILIFALVYFIYVQKMSFKDLTAAPQKIVSLVKKQVPVKTTEPVIRIDVGEEGSPKTERPKTTEKLEFTKEDVARLAAGFVERFGSYSNQANNANIYDLKIYMTRNMQIWADDYLAEQRKNKTDDTNYYGIITKAVSSDIKDFDEAAGRASVAVHTRRQEAESFTDNITNTFNQDITIGLLKEDGAWKVNSARWENKK